MTSITTDGTVLMVGGDPFYIQGMQENMNPNICLNGPTDYWNLEHFQDLKEHGCNFVETNNIPWSYYIKSDGYPNTAQTEKVLDVFADWAQQEHVYYLFTMVGFNGPSWKIPSWWNAGRTSDEFEVDMYNLAETDLNSARASVYRFWDFIADRYKNNSYVLLNFFNEPFYGNDIARYGGQASLHTQRYVDMVEKIYDTVRAAGFNNLIFVDFPGTYYHTSARIDVDRDVCYEGHLYLIPFTWINTMSTWKIEIDRFEDIFCTDFGKPCFIGEYGFIGTLRWDSDGDGTLDSTDYTQINADFYLRQNPIWESVLAEEVDYIENSTNLCGHSWHCHGWLYGGWYHYYWGQRGADVFDANESEWLMNLVLSGTIPDTVPPTPPSTLIFTDGEEGSSQETYGDFSAWDGTVVVGSESMLISTEYPHHGSLSFKSVTQGSQGYYGLAYRLGYVSESTLNLEIQNARFNGTPDVVSTGYTWMGVSGIDGVNKTNARAGIYNDNGTLEWFIRARHDGGFTNVHTIVATTPQINTNYSMELECIKNGTLTLYVNGTAECQLAGWNTDRAFNYTFIGFCFNEGTSSPATFWCDCVRMTPSTVDGGTVPPDTVDFLFADGTVGSTQETAVNFSAWDGTFCSSGNTAAITTMNPHHGSLSFTFYVDEDPTEWCMAYHELSDTINTLDIRAMNFRTTQGPGSVGARYQFMGFSRSGSLTYQFTQANIVNDDGTFRWGLTYWSDGSLNYYEPVISNTVAVDTDYTVEIQCIRGDGTNGTTRLYIDGTMELEVTGVSVGSEWARYAYIGNRNSGWVINKTTLNFDCVGISTLYIGVEGEGTAPPSISPVRQGIYTQII